MLSAPISTAPAASIRSISVASREDGAKSRLIFEPARVGKPCTSNRFFTANGTPASGPALFPAATAASIARALLRARSAVTSVNEFKIESCFWMRASAASVTSAADMLPPATPLAICEADNSLGTEVIAGSRTEDTGRLGFIGQRKFVDQPPKPQRDLEVSPHHRFPGILDRQGKCLCDGIDIIIKRIGSHFGSVQMFSAPATADAGSPSAAPLYRHRWDYPRLVRTIPVRRCALPASQ